MTSQPLHKFCQDKDRVASGWNRCAFHKNKKSNRCEELLLDGRCPRNYGCASHSDFQSERQAWQSASIQDSQEFNKRYTQDEPDLSSISDCRKKKVVITSEICTKFWNYRADSGHLYHLLFDLLGEEFVVSHRQDECLMKVLDKWDELQGKLNGWISGYLTSRKFVNDRIAKIHKDAELHKGEQE